MIIEYEKKLDYSDVLLCPKRSTIESRSEVNLIRKFKTRHGASFEGVPIVASNMACGNFKMLSALADHKMFTAISKNHSKEWTEIRGQNERLLYGFYTVGIRDQNEVCKLIDFYNDNDTGITLKIIVDVANGYMQKFSQFINTLRNEMPKAIIFAGNVCTPEMAQELIIAGADGIKCGIGPSYFCRTRTVAGVGYPQLSAVLECADACHGLDALIMADGGCSTPADVCKAFAANADLVMLGTMFAGTDECDGAVITKYEHDGTYNKIVQTVNNGVNYFNTYEPVMVEKKYKLFYGNSSDKAQIEAGVGVLDYRASEGLIEEVPLKGSVDIPVRNILGGLRSCCAYVGARELKHLPKCAHFVRVNKIK